MKTHITIYDIAKEAKVSPSTVSRVLTGNVNVSVEKSRKVREIIEKYDFQPNALARSLLKKESKTIGIILPDIVNPFFASVFMEAERYAALNGYSVILCNSVNARMEADTEAESMYLKMLVEKQVDGIIFLGGRVNSVKTDKALIDEMNSIISRTPVVMINGRMKGVDCYRVRSNERDGMYSTIEYLVSLGHRNIGFIGGIQGITSTSIKLKAFHDSLKSMGLPYNEKHIITSSYSIESGSSAMKELLSMSDRPTAVVAVNDFVAVGAIKYAVTAGIKIPEDISITSFDDSYLCNIITPSLTSVSHNIPELAFTAVNMLCASAIGKRIPKESIVSSKLVIRESCMRVI